MKFRVEPFLRPHSNNCIHTAFPAKGYTELLCRFFNELTHRLLHASGDNIVFGFSLLKHQPLHP